MSPVDFGTCLHAPATSSDAIKAEVRFAQALPPRFMLPIPNGAAVQLGGDHWVAQAGSIDAILHSRNGEVKFKALNGQRASFDPSNVIRSELCGARRYRRNEGIFLSGTMNVNPSSRVADADWCILFQIHQADMLRPDGSYVRAAPPLAIGLSQDRGDIVYLVVRSVSSKNLIDKNQFLNPRIIAKIPFEFGKDYHFKMHYTDGRGGLGQIKILVNGELLVDSHEETGYGYVSLLEEALPNLQATGSYLKFGIYAGWRADAVMEPSLRVEVNFSNLSTKKFD